MWSKDTEKDAILTKVCWSFQQEWGVNLGVGISHIGNVF